MLFIAFIELKSHIRYRSQDASLALPFGRPRLKFSCMPRLLPRLVKWFKSQPSERQTYAGPLITRRRPRRSLWKPIKTPPVTALEDRTQSILVDDDNVVNNRREYMRHKRVSPRLRLGKVPQLQDGELDVPREMTEQERQWWSSPYRKSGLHFFAQISISNARS